MTRVKFPYDESSFISNLFFCWAHPLIKFFTKTEPTLQNTPEIPKAFQFQQKLDQLKQNWQTQKTQKNPSFFKALFYTIGSKFFRFSLLLGLPFMNAILQAVHIPFIVDYLRDEEAPVWHGFIYMAMVVVPSLTVTLLMAYSGLVLTQIIAECKNWVCILISEKLGKVNSIVLNSGNTTGNVLNIIGNDIELFDLVYISAYLFILPIFIAAGCTALYFNIGYAGFVGYGLILLHLFLVFQMNKIGVNFRRETVRHADPRVKMTSNLVDGMKVFKLYGWQHPFYHTITKQREKECKGIKKLGFLQVMSRTLNFGLDGLAVFLPLYIYIHSGNEIEVEDAFSALSILIVSNQLIMHASNIALRAFFLFLAACQRITDVLLLKQTEPSRLVIRDQVGVQVKNAKFSWNQSSFALQNLNFEVGKGEIMIVTGSVGCGKSALLIALLNEMHKDQGSVNISGSVSYCSETPWLVSASVKDNILMGQQFHQNRYYQAVKSAALIKDLEMMPNGDQTLVGDKGVTLSGGQKTRICLARAFYADRDILLLDDPLSAVDTQVASQIFKNIQNFAYDGKVVILATHQVQFVTGVDKILVLDRGTLSYFGTRSDLDNRKDIQATLGQCFMLYKKQEQIKTQEEFQILKVNSGKVQLVEQEEKGTGKIPISVYFRFFMAGLKSPLVLILGFLTLVVSQICLLMVFLWVRIWANSDDQSNPYYSQVFWLIIVALYITGFARFSFLYFGLINSSKNLHNKALLGVTETNSTFFDKNPSGRIMNRFSKDTAISDEPLLLFLSDAIHFSFILVGVFALICILSPLNLIGVLLFIILFVFGLRKLQNLLKSTRRLELVSRSPLFTSINSIISGLVTIRCLNFSQKFSQDVKNAAADNMRASISFQVFLRFFQLFMDSGTATIVCINAIVVISLKGFLEPGQAALSLSLSASLLCIASFWAKCLAETDNFMSSVQRLLNYDSLPREGKYRNENDFKIVSGELVFDSVDMKYQEHLPLSLKKLTVNIKGGTHVGVVGRTGAGKSSILHVLFRLVNPDSGTIYIDKQDYLRAGLHDLRKQMSVIPQQPFIFKSSIRANIDPFREKTDQEILKILYEVKLGPFIQSLTENLDADISSSEVQLSAGQKQLICLARVILRSNKVVIMDEATANIDHDTDKFIQKQVRNTFRDSTVIIIAHRLRTIIRTQKVMVMNQGSCQEIGTPQELALKKESLFRKLIDYSTENEKNYLLDKLNIIDQW